MLPIFGLLNSFWVEVINFSESKSILNSFVREIRDAEIQKIPYMIIVGENEENANKVSVRRHGGEDFGMIDIDEFSNIIDTEIKKTLKEFIV